MGDAFARTWDALLDAAELLPRHAELISDLLQRARLQRDRSVSSSALVPPVTAAGPSSTPAHAIFNNAAGETHQQQGPTFSTLATASEDEKLRELVLCLMDMAVTQQVPPPSLNPAGTATGSAATRAPTGRFVNGAEGVHEGPHTTPSHSFTHPPSPYLAHNYPFPSASYTTKPCSRRSWPFFCTKMAETAPFSPLLGSFHVAFR